MIVEAQVPIHGSRGALWAVLADIERAADILGGVERVEIVARPAGGLVGLTWRETRVLFGKPATVEKRITEAATEEFFTTRAESDGFVFLTTVRISGIDGAVTLTSSHASQPQSLKARLSVPMLFLFRGVIRKAILQDLNDIKAAVERGRPASA